MTEDLDRHDLDDDVEEGETDEPCLRALGRTALQGADVTVEG